MNATSEAPERAGNDTAEDANEPRYSGSRRSLLGGAAGGLVLAASGLFLPDWLEETEARDGALGGAHGGRRGNNHRRRDRNRSHGDKHKKDKDKGRDDGQPRGNGPVGLRSSALTVVNNLSDEPLQCTFYYRSKTGLDEYDLPTADGAFSIGKGESHRYDPDRFRVGVLVKNLLRSGFDYYVDVRNVSYWFPRGGVTYGSNLDPASGTFGMTFIREQEFAEREAAETSGVIFRRANDTSRIEWRFVI